MGITKLVANFLKKHHKKNEKHRKITNEEKAEKHQKNATIFHRKI
jgi:hypothetical protein